MEKLLSELKELQISLVVKGDQLEVYDPKDNLTQDLVSKIKAQKQELLTYLNLAEHTHKTEAIPKAASKETYPATPAQRRLFFVYQLNKDTTTYNMPQIYKIKGALDIQKIYQVVDTLLRQHEILRSNFFLKDGEPVWKIRDTFDFTIAQHQADSEEDVEAIIKKTITPFNLEKDSLIRISIIALQEEEHIMIFDMHHIIGDGISNGILVRDFKILYEGGSLPDLKYQFKDYAEWLAQKDKENALENDRDFWLKIFNQIETPELPLDFKRPKRKKGHGASYGFVINEAQTIAMNKIAKEANTSLFMTLLTVFNVLLSKLSDQSNVVIGVPVRGREHMELEDMIGMFVNTLPVKNEVAGELPFIALLKNVSQRTLRCFDHQAYPYDQLVEDLKIKRSEGRNPLFDVSFTYDSFGGTEVKFEGLDFEGYDNKRNDAKFDITLIASEFSNGINIGFEYDIELFSEATIQRFGTYIQRIIDEVVKNKHIRIDELRIISETEKHQILHDFNPESTASIPEKTFLTAFKEQVSLQPAHTAVIFGSDECSYRELDEKSDALALTLVEKGIAEEEFIAVYMPRSVNLLVAVLGILKAGGAYVPIDMALPENRIQFMLDDTEAKHIIVSKHSKEIHATTANILTIENCLTATQKQSLSEKKSLPVIRPQQLCYVIFTSGSTGKPKGVMGEHKGLFNMSVNHAKLAGMQSKDRVLQFASFSFDAFAWEVFSTLLSGATLVMAAEAEIKSVEKIHQLLDKHQINCVTLPPSYLSFLKEKTHALRVVVSAGEPLTADLATSFIENGVQIINAYGPTENTVCSTYSATPVQEWGITIGQPLQGTKAYILDSKGEICPIGCIGELCVSGIQVARGYLKRNELTASNFIANPFDTGIYGKLYKTGDLARWMPDGNILFLGRRDAQVKIRGYRVELQEIAQNIRLVPAVEDAVVTLDEASQTLNAYMVSSKTDDANLAALIAEVTEQLTQVLPAYMIPSNYRLILQIPLTSNGKIDYKKLPKPESQTQVGPISDSEKQLIQIFAKVLEIDAETIHPESNFFELGGQSLKAMMLVNTIEKELSVHLSIDEVFDNPTVASLVQILGKSETSLPLIIPKAAAREYYPVSPAQRRMFFLYQLDKTATNYNMPQIYEVSGTTDTEFLMSVFKKIVARHESLRTTFHIVEKQVMQKIRTVDDFEIEILNWKEENIASNYERFIRPFDLETEYPIRIGFVQVDSGKKLLLIDVHHIVNDGHSQEILLKDFWQFYQKRTPLPLSLQYKDYATWLSNYKTGVGSEKDREFWLEEYSGEIPLLNLPYDYERPANGMKEGAKVDFEISDEMAQQLRQIASDEGVTLFTLMFTIYHTFLSNLCKQDTIVVGTPSAGRFNADLEQLVGIFLNILPVKSTLPADGTFTEFLQYMQQHVITCMQHQLYQYDKLLEELKLSRETGRNPLFDTIFTFNEAGTGSNTGITTDLEINPVKTNYISAKVDLELFVFAYPESMKFSFIFNKTLFSKKKIETFTNYLQHTIQQIINNKNSKISNMDLLSEKDKNKRLTAMQSGSKMATVYNTSVINMFQKVVDEYSENTALTYKGQQISYKELNAAANKFANFLAEEHAVKKGDIISLRLTNPESLLVATLGIMKVGATYVPVDPYIPVERVQFILNDSQSKHLITDLADDFSVNVITWDESIWSNKSEQREAVTVEPEQLVYVIYTSGTTGKPKGVAVPNRALSNYVHWFKEAYDVDASDETILLSSFAYDLCYTSVWGSLLSGGTLHLLQPDQHFNADEVISLLTNASVTFLKLTPSHFKMLSKTPGFQENIPEFDLRLVVLGGEEPDIETMKEYLQKAPITFVNEYGPTEATVGTIAYNIDKRRIKSLQSGATIGKAIDNVDVYVLDEAMQPVGEEMMGEIYLSGLSVASGYIHNEALTEEKFIDNPFATADYNKVLYKTGDYGKKQSDGTLVFMGRKDDQVNIRGYRIEPKEIETVVNQLPDISECAVLKIKNQLSEYQIVAYVVASEDLKEKEVTDQLAEKLPFYMIPKIEFVERIPLTANGKIDQEALITLAEEGDKNDSEDISQIEEKLIEIWSGILSVEQTEIKRNSDFFQLGGHSLIAIDLISEIKKVFSREIPLNGIFDAPTIKSQALIIQEMEGPKIIQRDDLILLKEGTEDKNLFIIHDGSGAISGYMDLVNEIEKFNCYGISYISDHLGPKNTTAEALATSYIERVKSIQESGPYHFAAWSIGGIILSEMVKQLQKNNESISSLVLIDTVFGGETEHRSFSTEVEVKTIQEFFDIENLSTIETSDVDGVWQSFVDSDYFKNMDIYQVLRKIPYNMKNILPDSAKDSKMKILQAINTMRTLESVKDNYELQPLDIPALIIIASDSEINHNLIRTYFSQAVINEVRGNHFSMMEVPNVYKIAELMTAYFEKEYTEQV
ncbi:amino acid adenylation domain-containing protein [Kordia periserrulae]|uniref:Amino acid adenylation domain-containing protein n=1 Tax=Kordia periserrulae TaxID=701523 RepID=A0A2T6BQU2_9FLAO|nr:non-ribosomal peptide synthetase [Kordia periserrulae]PTX58414.1 amino acid adenylation domain-containing protein [Kordia periserrulae]